MSRRSRPAAHQEPRSDIEALFKRHQHKLQRRVQAFVDTSPANVEDACMHAWLQFLRYELDEISESTSWLTTVAIREAVKLERGDRRQRPATSYAGEELERADPRDHYAARDQLAYAAAVIQEAGLSAGQLQMLSLQLWGLSYQQIAEKTGASRRTVERQVLRASQKIAEVLER